MATMDIRENPTLSNFIALKLAARRAKKSQQANTVTWMQTIVRLLLHVGGFSLLTLAGFSWNITAGLIVAGISCFALSWLNSGTSTNNNGPTTPRLR